MCLVKQLNISNGIGRFVQNDLDMLVERNLHNLVIKNNFSFDHIFVINLK